jgi:replicative superfamily II helicase
VTCPWERGDYDFHNEAAELDDDTLRQSALDGVGFHHAGLSRADKNHVETWFREGKIQLLFSTSTLAWGVNLPARCVVIRDTKLHDPLEGEVDMSPLDVLQMLGRAGRPGYDDRGYAWVVCDRSDADRYRRLLRDGKTIESRLTADETAEGVATDLAVHLNAEIVLGTVGDVEDAMGWLETTFYFVRAQRGSGYVGGDELRQRVSDTLSWLVDRGFVEMDGLAVGATPLGRLASTFYLRLETARHFADLAERDEIGEGEVLRAVASSPEFESVSARSDETGAIDAVLGERASDLGDGQRKVLAILEAAMDGTTPSALRSDAWVIRQNALRLLGALRALVDRFGSAGQANLVCRLAARVEHGISEDAIGLTAIDGVGETRASTLAAAGFRTPADVLDAGQDRIAGTGIAAGVAERVVESARELPAIEVDWTPVPDTIGRGERRLEEVTVRSIAGDARAGLHVTVNGVGMTTKDSYLGETILPIAVFGGDADELTFAIHVTFPELPLAPVVRTHSVRVVD